MLTQSSRSVEFRSIKHLLHRLNANRDEERDKLISVQDFDVPPWQRQIVWKPEDMGLLAYSIIRNYPIGMIVLWRKPDGIRVPIDGRQRLTAIWRFFEGQIAIPNQAGIPEEFRNAKFRLLEGDEDKGLKKLDIDVCEFFEDYEPSIIEYYDIDEKTAMDIFVKLQGGKSLTKTEVRAALGGRLCDFVTKLTSEPMISSEDEEDEEPQLSRHAFFQELGMRNTRKAHRNLCDVMLHEMLYPNQDKHWSSLETMYRDKAETFTDAQESRFRQLLGQFQRNVEISIEGKSTIIPQLRSTFLILTFFKAWLELQEYALPSDFSFAHIITEFETEREINKDDVPWVIFTNALSNAGYAQQRIDARHQILMTYIHSMNRNLEPKDKRRNFTESQKLALWTLASHQCQWESKDGTRCEAIFEDFHDADADHFVKWADGGPTTIENGRLLCQKHNRARR